MGDLLSREMPSHQNIIYQKLTKELQYKQVNLESGWREFSQV